MSLAPFRRKSLRDKIEGLTNDQLKQEVSKLEAPVESDTSEEKKGRAKKNKKDE